MQETTLELLNTLNRDFYDTFAQAFADSRAPSEPGLTRYLAEAMPGARVLDLGCGMGRIALLLPQGCVYTGVDFSEALLTTARERATEAGVVATFIAADLTAPDWASSTAPPYDWIILRAVLHHIPGYAQRLRIVQEATTLLAPGGSLLLANWQFLSIARLRRRLQPWSEIGLTEADVEPGDYLLDWQREGRGLRYVHLVDESETRRLADAAGLTIAAMTLADGHENKLTLYALLRETG